MILINGRFLSAPQSGVQRVASNLVVSLDRSLSQDPLKKSMSVELRCPRNTHSQLQLDAIRTNSRSSMTGQVWEQFEYCASAPRDRLINLCNTGPILKNSAVSMVHDAQAYISPESYSKAFVSWYRFMLPRLARHSDVLLTVSNYSRQMLARYGVAPAERIAVIPNGVDHVLRVQPDRSVVEKLSLKGRDFVVAFGSMQAHKNIGVLLNAFANPRLAQMLLILIGDLDWKEIEARFSISPLPNIRLAGRLSDGEIRALLEGALCIAHPSFTEGFGLPPLEAMILGCPAVVASAGALPEVCADGAAYADPHDVDSWVDTLLETIQDSSGRAGRVAKAKQVAGAFTWERAGRLLRSTIESTL